MEEPQQLTNSADVDEDSENSGVAGPFIGVITATAVLYFGREILLPLTMAAILAVVFSPVANWLERFIGRFASAAAVVLAAVAAVGAIGYFLTVELTSVAVEVAGYSDNIGAKLATLEKSTPTWLQRVEQGIAHVRQQLENPKARPKTHSISVESQPLATPAFSDVLKQTVPVATGFGEALLIIVLLFFLLYSRRDLRDRFVRLAARGRITIAAQAIQTASETVGRYLLLFALINFGFGIAVGVTVWLLGLPNPEFWGGLAFLLRFVPYVGALCSAILPTLVAFAVFPGWSRSFEVLGSFVVFDQVAAELLEPFLIGKGIGVAPVALLVSAMYWAWLWGIPGLLLATPITACLKVAADYIPPLGFFAVLLGADSGADDSHQEYYRQLLELNQSGAKALATRYCDEHGLESTFDDILAPAVRLMGNERELDHISQDNQQFILDTTRELIVELGNRFEKPRMEWRLRILGVCAPGEVHSLGLLMLLEVLRQDGAAATFMGESKSLAEVRDFVRRFAPDLMCLSCATTECVPAAVELTHAINADFPYVTIVAGGSVAVQEQSQLLAAGCTRVFLSRREARRAIRRLAGQRSGRTKLFLTRRDRPIDVTTNASGVTSLSAEVTGNKSLGT